MKKAQIKVDLNIGKTLYFVAEEVKSNSGYGRDTYVIINRLIGTEEEEFQYLDCRYIINYDFKNLLTQVFTEWYGSKLVALTIN